MFEQNMVIFGELIGMKMEQLVLLLDLTNR
jgi:hypothetical protein